MASPSRPSTPQNTTTIRGVLNNTVIQNDSQINSLNKSNSNSSINKANSQSSDRKRPLFGSSTSKGNIFNKSDPKKRQKIAYKELSPKLVEVVAETQMFLDLLEFERKLDFTIMRKRLNIQEAIKKPLKQRRKLRIFISNTFFPGKIPINEGDEAIVPSWELRVEGRLLEDTTTTRADPLKGKRKFSSFFKSLVIELDKNLYGPDNHLVEWHRTPATNETDGFQVRRPGDKNVKCTILLLLDYQPLQYKLDSRLARLLGIHTQTKPVIINALWQYIKAHKLQNAQEKEYINCDKCLEQIFKCPQMKFCEIPQRINQLLHPADPVIIKHMINTDGSELKKTSCYDIDVEVDDPIKAMMTGFLQTTSSHQELEALDQKIQATIEAINQFKIAREFYLSFAENTPEFIDRWIVSQTKDYQTMTDIIGNPEDERRSDYFFSPWSREAVCRYFSSKVQQRRSELEQALGVRNS